MAGHKRLYVHPRAMHIICTALIFSTIGFTQSVNMYKTTDTDCLPIWQIWARYRYRLSVNHYPLPSQQSPHHSQRPPSPNFLPRRCYSCGSTAHLQRNCDRRPPIRARGRTRGGGYPNNRAARTSDTITCFNCSGLGHFAGQCPSPLN